MDNMWNRALLSTGEHFWIQIAYTLAVLSLLLLCQFARFQIFSRNSSSRSAGQSSTPPVSRCLPSTQQHRVSDIITDLDLKLLIDNLEETVHENDQWESVVDRSNNSLSYHVKCCKPKDGSPIKYVSTTVFNFCSSETLRDFYMDNSYRKEWDKTLIEHEQLEVDQSNGTEIGRTIKKFPLLTPREYILAWRLWEGTDKTYYCYSKECEHPKAPRQKKFVRVGLFRSGWRIREGRGNSCEIKMVHQEDAGLNVDMAKMIFSKGIWSYVCKMDNALRKYSASRRLQLASSLSAITLVQKVPLSLDSCSSKTVGVISQQPQVSREKKVSKKLIANGLILVGGVICLSRGHANFSGKVAMAYILSKLTKRHQNKQLGLH